MPSLLADAIRSKSSRDTQVRTGTLKHSLLVDAINTKILRAVSIIFLERQIAYCFCIVKGGSRISGKGVHMYTILKVWEMHLLILSIFY